MKHTRDYYLIIVALLHCAILAKELSVSIVIPCVPKHAQHLYNLITHYTQQTVLPQEIVIALSESHNIPPALIHTLKQDHAWPFPVHIVHTNKKMYAGTNRNNGADNATGVIIMFQDADDIPHPQRIEIVKYFFETYSIVHLLHLWIPEPTWITFVDGPKTFVPYTLNAISFEKLQQHTLTQIRVTNGNPCILRSVLQKVRWPTHINVGEDAAFNSKMINEFPGKCFVIHAYLLLYRNSLSSYILRQVENA